MLCLNGAIGGRLGRTARWHDGLQVFKCTTHSPAASSPWTSCRDIFQHWVNRVCGLYFYVAVNFLQQLWRWTNFDCCMILYVLVVVIYCLNGAAFDFFSQHKETIRIYATTEPPCIGFMVIPSSNWRRCNDDDRKIDKFAVMCGANRANLFAGSVVEG